MAGPKPQAADDVVADRDYYKEELKKAHQKIAVMSDAMQTAVSRQVPMHRYNRWAEHQFAKLSAMSNNTKKAIREDGLNLYGPKGVGFSNKLYAHKIAAYRLLTVDLKPVYAELGDIASRRWDPVDIQKRDARIEELLELEKPLLSKFAFHIARGYMWAEFFEVARSIVIKGERTA